MKQRVYGIAEGKAATIAPATEMVPCDWCGYKLTPAIPRVMPRPDDVVTYRGGRICVTCGMREGVVVMAVV